MWKADQLEQPGPSNTPSNTDVIAKAIELAAAAGRRGRYTDYVVKAREALMQAAPVIEDEPPPAEPAFEAIAAAERFDKLGARNSAADLEHIQAAHDHLCALGADCGGMDDKILRAAPSPDVDALWATIDLLQKRLDDLAGTPAPPKALAGAARAIGKAEDANPGDPTPSPEDLKKYLAALPAEDRGRLELMAALRRPIPIGR